MVFALPGEPGLTELAGDFKIHFHDRQGDFYCWLNTTMIENRKILNTSDLDGFDKRKLPSPGFQVEVVLVDYDAAAPPRPRSEIADDKTVESSGADTPSEPSPVAVHEAAVVKNSDKNSGSNEKDDVFSDSEAEETGSLKSKEVSGAPDSRNSVNKNIGGSDHKTSLDQSTHLSHETERLSLGSTGSVQSEPRKDAVKGSLPNPEVSNPTANVSQFKAMAADASVFTFGDEEDYESE